VSSYYYRDGHGVGFFSKFYRGHHQEAVPSMALHITPFLHSSVKGTLAIAALPAKGVSHWVWYIE
jgi:hypothetical protein